ncbi:lycopene cyclase domain-containing protein [Lutibacter holmesii]|uniref:Lycopene cyclase domain-containing protein n=1 Tax=Lutibacter holmesii TaxID=1137985 RepID=A0ABW3WPU0_9FLAO
MTYLYLLINIASFSVPFIYSFEKKMLFIQYWKAVFLAILLVAVPFLIWDVIFTEYGVWGFNPTYYLGITFFGLPAEEILFFICIPFASIFTHYAFLHFFKNLKLSNKVTQIITLFLLITSIVVLIFAFPKAYTSVNFSLFTCLMLYAFLKKDAILNRFYITFLVVLIPFFIVNGLLTGSFIPNEIVWYNNAENLGVRIGTVPIEDAFYAFSMLYSSLILIEKFKLKFNKS